jgi:hypothetical protein
MLVWIWTFLRRSFFCVPEHFTDADCTMTNEQILKLPTHDARALCRKCKFKSLSNSGTLVMKNISTSSSLSEMTKRLLSYFHVYCQQLALSRRTGLRKGILTQQDNVAPCWGCSSHGDFPGSRLCFCNKCCFSEVIINLQKMQKIQPCKLPILGEPNHLNCNRSWDYFWKAWTSLSRRKQTEKG